MNMNVQQTLEQIAKEYLGFNTLEPQHSDSADFKEVSVYQVKEALMEAFTAGFKTGEIGH